MKINENFSIVFPDPAEGQDRWDVYQMTPRFETPPDERNLFQRAMFKLLVYLHVKTDKFSLWAYKMSCRYEPPAMIWKGETIRKVAEVREL